MTFQIKLLGTSFTIKTDEDPEYLKQVVWFYKKKIEETEKSVNIQDPLKISLLTSLGLVDELLKMRNNSNGQIPPEYSKIEEDTEHQIDKILMDLDKAIEE